MHPWVAFGIIAYLACGAIAIAGRTCDATCQGGFISKGSRVRVVKQQGFNLVVERVLERSVALASRSSGKRGDI